MINMRATFLRGLEQFINKLKNQNVDLSDDLQLELESWGLELGDLVLIDGRINVVLYYDINLKDEVCLLELRNVGDSRSILGLEDYMFLPDLVDLPYTKVTWQQTLDHGGIWEKFKDAS